MICFRPQVSKERREVCSFPKSYGGSIFFKETHLNLGSAHLVWQSHVAESTDSAKGLKADPGEPVHL